MKNFIKVLNKIALGYTMLSANPQDSSVVQDDDDFGVNNHDACCTIVNFFDPQSFRFESIEALRETRIRENLNYASYKRAYINDLFGIVSDFIADYCECNEPGMVSPCKQEFDDKINAFRTINKWIEQAEADFESYPSFIKTLPIVLHAFSEFIDIAVDTFQTAPSDSGYTEPRTDTFKNFMDDMCSMQSYSNPDPTFQYETTLAGFLDAINKNPVLDRLITDEYFGIRASTIEENVYVGCPPSPNDNSIVALATALGVSTVVAAIAYNAITRGKAKKCSDLATSSSRLTPLIIAAVVGSFATTQTSEATVQEKLQAVMQKECEGRLPYSCGDGGFEGPDEGDGSGEVDAPGGEGGIEGGML